MYKSNSVFIEAQCLTYKKTFYYRYDYNAANRWVLSGTSTEEEYKSETTGNNQGEKLTKIEISKAVRGPQFRGCPYCGNRSFLKCGTCEILHCYDGESDGFTCPTDKCFHKLSGGLSSLNGKRAGQ